MRTTKTIKKLSVVLAGSWLAVACSGQSSDALKDYRDVKSAPKTEVESDVQIYAISPFQIQMEGAEANRFPQMIEGKESSFVVELIPAAFQISSITGSSLEIESFPPAFHRPTVQKISAFKYRITWKPEVGTIPVGSLSKDVSLRVVAKPTDKDLQNLGTAEEIVIMVNKNIMAPKLVSIDHLPKEAQEGKKIDFTIDIEDPTFDGQRVPKIAFTEIQNSNIEGYVASAGTYIKENRAQNRNPYVYPQTKRFRYFYTMDLTKLPEDYDRTGKLDTNAPSVNMCFNISVFSSNGVTAVSSDAAIEAKASTELRQCIKGIYMSQPAIVTWAQNERVVLAGKENKFQFTISTSNGLSKILNLDTDKIIRNLKGEKKLTCSANETQTEQRCELVWTPESVCGKKDKKGNPVAFPANKKVSLSMNIKTELNKNTKQKEEKVEFEVTDLEKDCAISASEVGGTATPAASTEGGTK